MPVGQDIDGQSFLELTTDDLNRLFPDSLGTVKKIYRLVQSVSFNVCVCVCVWGGGGGGGEQVE